MDRQVDIVRMQRSFPHLNYNNMKVYQEGKVIMQDGIENGRKQLSAMQQNEQLQQVTTSNIESTVT